MNSLNKRFRSSLLLYNLVLMLYRLAIRIAATFNPKAKKWVAGRKNWLQKLKADFDFNELKQIKNGKKRKTIWLHAASLGEFEQGRPIMEGIKKRHPNCILVLTFFSPSGYEIRKNYGVADYVYYLPLDSRRNAQQFVEAIQPDFVVFVKYEFWYYYFEALKQRNIPIFIISAIFRPNQHFFKWYGSLFRALLQYCEHIFVQNEQSLQLLQNIGIEQVSIAGDTRLDRVFDNSESAKSIPIVEALKGNRRLWVAGSTWAKDEEILAEFLTEYGGTEARKIERRDGETERNIEHGGSETQGSLEEEEHGGLETRSFLEETERRDAEMQSFLKEEEHGGLEARSFLEEEEHGGLETQDSLEEEEHGGSEARSFLEETERRDAEVQRNDERRDTKTQSFFNSSKTQNSCSLFRLIIAPHEIHEKHLAQIEALLSVKSIRYSHCSEETDFEGTNIKVLIIDNIGLLSSIYQYADYVFIGGGFGAGIHNTLEAAVFGMPIFFGPNYEKFQEAVDLIEVGGAYAIEGVEDLVLKVKELEKSEELYEKASLASQEYVLKNKGGSELILKVLNGYFS